MSAGPASHDRPTPPRGDEGELFARHHAALLRAVRRAVRAPEAVIEDACASAWAILLRRQPDRGPALFGWLRTVAVHEGYRLSREQRHVSALDDLAAVEGEGWEAFVADRRTLDASLEARRALRTLAALPERERRYLALLAAGYRYHEIVEHAGVTYTNVNKHLAKARSRIRDVESAA